MRPALFAAIAITAAAPAFAAEPAVKDIPVKDAAVKPVDVSQPAVKAKASGIGLTMDEVRTLTFNNPITTIYVGNPSIADITMIDARHAFVQGKAYGRTNIVALNHDGVQVYNARIDVSQGGVETLTLNRGVQRITYNCNSGRCEAQPTPGDSKDVFEQMTSQLANHADIARKAAGAAN